MRISDWSSDVCSSDLRRSKSELRDQRNMVGRPFPAARRLDDAVRARVLAKVGGRPHMVEPAAAVRRLPILCAIAPPGVEWLRRGDEVAAEVDPVRCRPQLCQSSEERLVGKGGVGKVKT